MKPFVEDGVHPRIVIKALRAATQIAIDKIKEISKQMDSSPQKHRVLMEECAATALNSKLIHGQKEFFCRLVVDAVMMLDELLPLSMIGMKKVIKSTQNSTSFFTSNKLN